MDFQECLKKIGSAKPEIVPVKQSYAMDLSRNGAKREKRTAITVCWNYSDYLRHTLPVNRKFFDDFIILTSLGDKETQEIGQKYDCKMMAAFTADAVFNKGKAINKAIPWVEPGWIVHIDADTLMPYPLEAWEMIFAGLDPANIYGCDRMNVPSFEMFQGVERDAAGYLHVPGAQIMQRFCFDVFGGWVPIGFWQAWHSKHRRFYPENIPHAGDSDAIFAAQWPRSQRVLLPEASVLHLSTVDSITGMANWHGRSTMPFCGSMQIG